MPPTRQRDPLRPYLVSIETVPSTAQPIPIPDFMRIKKDPYSSCNCGLGLASVAARNIHKDNRDNIDVNYEPPTVDLFNDGDRLTYRYVDQQTRIIERHVTAIVSTLGCTASGCTLVVAANRHADLLQVIRTLAAGGIAKVVTAVYASMTTAAFSYLIQRHNALGGILIKRTLSPSSAEPSSISIKFNGADGGACTEEMLKKLYTQARSIMTFKSIRDIEFNSMVVGQFPFPTSTRVFIVYVIDPAKEYADLMENSFDFSLIRDFLNGGRGFKLKIDAQNGIYASYIREIFHGRLGAPLCDLFGISHANHLIGYPSKIEMPAPSSMPSHSPSITHNQYPKEKVNFCKEYSHDSDEQKHSSKPDVEPVPNQQTPMCHPAFTQGFVPTMNPLIDPTFNPSSNPFPLNPYLMNPFLLNYHATKTQSTNSKVSDNNKIRSEVNSPQHVPIPPKLHNPPSSPTKTTFNNSTKHHPDLEKPNNRASPKLYEKQSLRSFVRSPLSKIVEEPDETENLTQVGEKSSRVTKFTVTPVDIVVEPTVNLPSTIRASPVFKSTIKQPLNAKMNTTGVNINVNANSNKGMNQYKMPAMTPIESTTNNSENINATVQGSTYPCLDKNTDNINQTTVRTIQINKNNNQIVQENSNNDAFPNILQATNQIPNVKFNSITPTQPNMINKSGNTVHDTSTNSKNVNYSVNPMNLQNTNRITFDNSNSIQKESFPPDSIRNTSEMINENNINRINNNEYISVSPIPIQHNHQIITNTLVKNNNLQATNNDLFINNLNTKNSNTSYLNTNPSIPLSNPNFVSNANFTNAPSQMNSNMPINSNANVSFISNINNAPNNTTANNVNNNTNETRYSNVITNNISNMNTNMNSNVNTNDNYSEPGNNLEQDESNAPNNKQYVNPIVGGCFPRRSFVNNFQPNNFVTAENLKKLNKANHLLQKDSSENYQQMNHKISLLLNELIANQQINQLSNKQVEKIVTQLNNQMAHMSMNQMIMSKENQLLNEKINKTSKDAESRIKKREKINNKQDAHEKLPTKNNGLSSQKVTSFRSTTGTCQNNASDGIRSTSKQGNHSETNRDQLNSDQRKNVSSKLTAGNAPLSTKRLNEAKRIQEPKNNKSINCNQLPRRERSETNFDTSNAPGMFTNDDCTQNQLPQFYNPYSQWDLIPPTIALQEWLNSPDLVAECEEDPTSIKHSENNDNNTTETGVDLNRSEIAEGKDNIIKDDSKDKDTSKNIATDESVKSGDDVEDNKTTKKGKKNKKKIRIYDFNIIISDEIKDCRLFDEHGSTVSMSDSFAVIADNLSSIPYFQNNPIEGIAKCNLSSAINKVAERKSWPVYEVSSGWRHFKHLLVEKKVTICACEGYGISNNVIKEQDMIWTILSWLSLLAKKRVGVNVIMRRHWIEYGRNYFTRHDCQDIENDLANILFLTFERSIKAKNSFNKTFEIEKSTVIELLELKRFTSLDKTIQSPTESPIMVALFADSSKFTYLIGTDGTNGNSLRIYVDRYVRDRAIVFVPEEVCLEPMLEIAISLTRALELPRNAKIRISPQ